MDNSSADRIGTPVETGDTLAIDLSEIGFNHPDFDETHEDQIPGINGIYVTTYESVYDVVLESVVRRERTEWVEDDSDEAESITARYLDVVISEASEAEGTSMIADVFSGDSGSLSDDEVESAIAALSALEETATQIINEGSETEPSLAPAVIASSQSNPTPATAPAPEVSSVTPSLATPEAEWGVSSAEHRGELVRNPDYMAAEANHKEAQQALAMATVRKEVQGFRRGNKKALAEAENRVLESQISLISIVNAESKYDVAELAAAIAARDIVERTSGIVKINVSADGDAVARRAPSYKQEAAAELLENKSDTGNRIKKILKVAGYVSATAGIGAAAITAGVAAGAIAGGVYAARKVTSKYAMNAFGSRVNNGNRDLESGPTDLQRYEAVDWRGLSGAHAILQSAMEVSSEASDYNRSEQKKAKRSAALAGIAGAAVGMIAGARLGDAAGNILDTVQASDLYSPVELVPEIVSEANVDQAEEIFALDTSDIAEQETSVETPLEQESVDPVDDNEPQDTVQMISEENDISDIFGKPGGYLFHNNDGYSVVSQTGAGTDSIWAASESILEDRLGEKPSNAQIAGLMNHFIESDEVLVSGPQNHIVMGQVMEINNDDLNEILGIEDAQARVPDAIMNIEGLNGEDLGESELSDAVDEVDAETETGDTGDVDGESENTEPELSTEEMDKEIENLTTEQSREVRDIVFELDNTVVDYQLSDEIFFEIHDGFERFVQEAMIQMLNEDIDRAAFDALIDEKTKAIIDGIIGSN